MEEKPVYEVKFAPSVGGKPGRPKGTLRPPVLEVRYPIRWKDIYDEFLMDSLKGLSNRDIGLKYDYSAVQVGNVLNSPIGKEKAEKLKAQLMRLSPEEEASFEERERKIKEKTLKAMEGFLDDPNGLSLSAPLPYIDKVIKIAALQKPVGTNNTTNIQVNNQKTLMISGEMAKNVTEALAISKEIGLLASGNDGK